VEKFEGAVEEHKSTVFYSLRSTVCLRFVLLARPAQHSAFKLILEMRRGLGMVILNGLLTSPVALLLYTSFFTDNR